MPTIDRQGPFRVIIYLNDHEPAHVHVWHTSGVIVIDLLGDEGEPRLREVRGEVKDNDVKRAFGLAQRNQAAYLERWNEIHGDPK